jgi:hypothetical protein
MKLHITFFIFIVTSVSGWAQSHQENNTKSSTSKVGWYIAPEMSAMFLDSHVGKALGFQMGLQFFKDRLKVGYFIYARSGPINNETFTTDLQEGVTYKGKSQLQLRADHGAFGLMIAPSFKLPNSKIEIDVPIMIGSVAAGFYLADDDRKTPDGRRVSEWENELFDEQDASFGGLTEFGVRAFFPTKNPSVKIGIGIQYTLVSDLKTYYDPNGDFYNNKFRTSLLIQFGSPRK